MTFRVWAPRRRSVEVVIERGPGTHPGKSRHIRLSSMGDGYFTGRVLEAAAGTRYRYRLDGEGTFPDPASRFQPEGIDGPSEVIDLRHFPWTDDAWRGIHREGQVLYEMHVGTFTREGTWEAAERELPVLAELGITVIELMPVADFCGQFGWGYDGVALFAPTRLYGRPEAMCRFVDRAHALGIGVIQDVVFHRLGAVGNPLREYSEDYFSRCHGGEWGDLFNFDGENARPVRDFILACAGCWIDVFHLDGFRIDAVQGFVDASPDHILAELSRHVRGVAHDRSLLLVGEYEPQQTHPLRPTEQGGYGLDALWIDDFHHSAMVALTRRNESYYTDHRGAPQEFVSAAVCGPLYQGQFYYWQGKRRGRPALELPPAAFVYYLQNHDQLANSLRGERLHRLTGPARARALTALFLLMPQTPMLFQGQEFWADSPFVYFADVPEALVESVHQGRREHLGQARSMQTPEVQAAIPRPDDRAMFEASKLDHGQRARNGQVVALHRDLLRMRREDPVFRRQRPRGVAGAVLGPEAFVLRYFGDDGDDRLVVVNLGLDLHLRPMPEPLLAPPEGCRWALRWSSADLAYGGHGTPPLELDWNWRLPGETTLVLAPMPDDGTYEPLQVDEQEAQAREAGADEPASRRERERPPERPPGDRRGG